MALLEAGFGPVVVVVVIFNEDTNITVVVYRRVLLRYYRHCPHKKEENAIGSTRSPSPGSAWLNPYITF